MKAFLLEMNTFGAGDEHVLAGDEHLIAGDEHLIAGDEHIENMLLNFSHKHTQLELYTSDLQTELIWR